MLPRRGVSLLFQFLQAFSGRIRKDALADGLHHIADFCFALLKLLFQHRRYSILLFLHDDNGIRNSTYYGTLRGAIPPSPKSRTNLDAVPPVGRLKYASFQK